jgi:ribosomal protein S12 methylthiotransferase accessory factor
VTGTTDVDYDLLVDSRYGVIRSLDPHPHGPEIPHALHSFTATVGDTQRLGLWHGDRVALGAAFFDAAQARRAAVGEAVERYCGNFIPRGLRRASYRDLRVAGENPLDPEEVILYSERQYREAGFPFVPLSRDRTVYWTEGRDLLTERQVLVPASLVYINYYVGRLTAEPPTNFVMYAGIAAGAGREAAERSALEELIERDATVIWWHSGSPAVGIDPDGSPLYRSALAVRSEGDLSYHLVNIPSLFEVPVIGALIRDRRHQIVALGVACRPDPAAAALKAVAEAIHLRSFALGLLDPRGSVWRSMEVGILDPGVYQPYRADRAYRDSYRADFRDVTDLGAHSQLYLDPHMHHHVRRILEPPSWERLPPEPLEVEGDLRRGYLDLLARHGFRAVSVDVTTPDVRQAGLVVVRVLVPGLYPNAPAAFPCLGGRRLYEEPARLGLLLDVLREEDLDLTPLPHS